MPEQVKHKNRSLPLMEGFHTIQGEGEFQGCAAYFVRLGGCDVGCVWCDVKDSWDVDAHPLVPIEQISQNAVNSGAEIVVITGGEPLMHPLEELTNSLKEKGLKTHLETSGAYELSGNFDWVCVSPKKFKHPLKTVLESADELKVVIYHKSDFKWAEQHASLVSNDCKLFLQPEWDKRNEMMPLIIDYVKQNPKWQISLQIHKYIGVD